MRLLSILSFLLLGSSAWAGVLSLADKSGNSIDGMTIDLWGDVNTPLLKLEFDARNTGSVVHTSKMKKIEISEVPGSQNMICWDVCYLEDSVMVSTGTVTLNPNATWLYGATDYYPYGNTGVTTVRYVIFNTGNPNDTSWFVVNYHITAVGIQPLSGIFTLSPSYPNPASEEFFIPVHAQGIQGCNGQYKIVLTGINGGRVNEYFFSDPGMIYINTRDLETGSYLYTVFKNGVVIGSGRQTILH